MENPGRRVSLNPVPDVQMYNTSTPVSQLHQPTPDEYNQFNFKILKLQLHPSGKTARIFLKTLRNLRGAVCTFLMVRWHT